MIKSDLVRRVAGKNPHLHAKDAERIVNAVLDVIGAALARRDRVETRGFGVFTVRLQSARPGRNPKNGAAVSVPAKFYPYFRPSKAMHSRLNRPPSERSVSVHLLPLELPNINIIANAQLKAAIG
jgi:integration host factor subunit beta